MVHMGKSIIWQYPFNDQLWHVDTSVTSSKLLYYLQVMLLHILPGFFIDLLLRLLGKKPMLVQLQRKIYIANMAVQYFLTNEWAFLNSNSMALEKALLPEDVKGFGFKADEFNVYDYLFKAMKGARKYLLKEDESSLESAIKHSRRWVCFVTIAVKYYKISYFRMYLLYQIVNFSYYVFAFWLVVYKINIFKLMYNIYCNLFFCNIH